jgi:two-component system, NarL family, sensor histidine kinase NreB
LSTYLIIEDDGIGFDPTQEPFAESQENKLGLVNMRERAALIGGALEIESSPDNGTTVFVRIPLDDREVS